MHLRFEPLEDRAVPATMYGVEFATNRLLQFDSATPTVLAADQAVTGLQAGELILGLDTRPATGELYALGIVDDGATRTGRIYRINPTTAVATQVGAAPWSTTLQDTNVWGFDFNPTVDRIRIVNDNAGNFRVHPDTGALVATDTNLSVAGVESVAYTNSDGFVATTTLYGTRLAVPEQLVTIGGINGTPSPNLGQVFNVGNLGIVSDDSYSLDIEAGTNIARATARVGGVGKLFTIDLTTGAATLVGNIGPAPRNLASGLTSATTALAVAGTAGADTLVVTATGANSGSYSLNGGPAVNFTGITSFAFIASAGADTLTINNPAGGIFAPVNGIVYHGGGQVGDSLFNLGGSATSGSYLPGPTSTSGILSNVLAATTQTINFNGLSPVTDTVAAANFTINASAGADTINVVDGPIVGVQTTQVNFAGAFELINFANKTTVAIDAGAGSDTVTVAHTLNAAGLAQFTIDGNAAADTDTLIVNGRAGIFENFRYTPTAAGAGNVFIDDGNMTPISFANLDALLFAMQAADGDGMRIDGTIGDDAFTYQATTTAGDGSFTGTMDANNATGGGPFALVAFSLTGIAASNDMDVNFFVVGGTDTFLFQGTTSTDQIDVFGGAVQDISHSLVGGGLLATLQVFNTVGRSISAGAGDDVVALGNGATLGTGTVDGGADVDRIDYAAYTTAVAVNLGLGTTGFSPTLTGLQEVPANASTATATGTVAYNALTKQATIALTVTNFFNTITDFHIHRGVFGVSGPVIVPIGAGVFVPTGNPGEFTVNTVVNIPAVEEASFLGGRTYFNIHSNIFPGGEIRGQLYTNGNVNLATGTATGTAGIANIENATGGSGNDSLVGNFGVNLLTGNAGGDVLLGGPGADTFDGGIGNDVMIWSNGDGSDVMDGGADSDNVQVNGNVVNGDTFAIAPNGGVPTRLFFQRTSAGPFSLDIGTTETLFVNGIGGNDTFNVADLATVADLTGITLNGEDGSDTLVGPNLANTWNITGSNAGTLNAFVAFATTETLTGNAGTDDFNFGDGFGVTGAIDGAGGTDTLNYSAYTTAIAVNLGLGTTGFSPTLTGLQEAPANASTATATGTIAYNALTKQATIALTVTNFFNTITDFHIHRGVFGVSGPVIVPIGAGVFVPTGNPGEFTVNTVVNIPAVEEASFLGGRTYFNIHSNIFPGGEIRGQLYSNGNVSLSTGTATGTGGILNIENATGGGGNDSLVGNTGANTLTGNAGNDVMLGGPGGDSFFGNAGLDVMIWSNGDGTDNMDGGADADAVQVNGSVAGGDAFLVAPDGGVPTRLRFDRTNLGLFGLNITTTEELVVDGIGGNDSFTVNDLAGVADLNKITLNGQEGSDTFNVRTQLTVQTFVVGNNPTAADIVPPAEGDVLDFDSQGFTVAPTVNEMAQAGRQSVNYTGIETRKITAPGGTDLVIDGTNGNDIFVLFAGNQFELNGVAFRYTVGPLNLLTFNGLNGDDTVIVDYTNGDPMPAGGFVFNGGNQGVRGDMLIVRDPRGFVANGNNKTVLANYTPAPTIVDLGQGTITLNEGIAGPTRTIIFTGLEPVFYDGLAAVNLNLVGDGDVVTMETGAFDFDGNAVTPDEAGLRFFGTTGGLAFEWIAARDVGTITVNTQDTAADVNGDVVTLSSGDNDHRNQNLNIVTRNAANILVDAVNVDGPVVFDTKAALPLAANTITIVTNGTISFDNPIVNAAKGSLAAPDLVDLRAFFGGIVSSAAAGTDIRSNFIALRASGDIGATANRLETRVYAFDPAPVPNNNSHRLEANSDFGDIYLQNTGNLFVGGVDAGLFGITAVFGEIVVVNSGALSIVDNGETVFASGNISLTANDPVAFIGSGDIFTGGQTGDRTNVFVRRAVQSTGATSTISLQADRHISLGDAIGWGDVLNQTGVLTLITADFDQSSTGDASITNSTLVQVLGAGGLLTIFGDNVFVTNTAASFAALQTAGGQISLIAGFVGMAFEGVVDIDVGVANAALGITDTVDTTAGAALGAEIFVQADDVLLTAGGAGILAFQAGNSSINIFLVDLANVIELGNLVDAGRMNLVDAEFDLMAGSIIRVGGDPANFASNAPLNTGNLSVTSVVTQPLGWNTLALRTQGVISETAAGGLTVDNLLLVGLGGVDCCAGTNDIGTLAGLTNGASFAVSNTRATFTIGTVDGTSGITTNGGDITIFAPNAALTINQPILTTFAAAVRLTARNGITQGVNGRIEAGTLGARNQGVAATLDIELTNANNRIGQFAAFNQAADRRIRLVTRTWVDNTNVLVIGSVASNGACFVATTGIATTDGADAVLPINNDVSILVSNGNLTDGAIRIDQSINATADGTVRLYAIAGIRETQPAGVVVAGLLSALNAGTGGDLEFDANNQVGTFAAFNAAAGRKIGLKNVANLTVGSVTADSLLPARDGVQTVSGDVILAAYSGSLQVDRPILAGLANTALLADNGIAQANAGRIESRFLGAENASAGNIVLDSTANIVNVFAGRNAVPGGIGSANGHIRFRNTISFAVGTLTMAAIDALSIQQFETDKAPNLNPADNSIVGAIVANGEISLLTTGAVVFTSPVNAGTGLLAITATASVQQYAGAEITAGQLGIINGPTGPIVLALNNQLNGILAVRNTTVNGYVYIVNRGNVTVGTVNPTALFAGVGVPADNGIQTSNGELALLVDGALAITRPIAIGTAKALLQSTKGMSQTPAGTIFAGDLLTNNIDGVLPAAGSIFLSAANDADNYAARNGALNGQVIFNDVDSVSVTIVPGIVSFVGGWEGIQTNNGDVLVASGGALTLNRQVRAGTADVRLKASTGVTSTQFGPIFGDELAVENVGAAGNVTLQAANTVNTVAIRNAAAGGTIAFSNFGNLIVGTVAGIAPLTATVIGITANNGAVQVNVGSDLTVNSPIDTNGGSLSMNASTDVRTNASVTTDGGTATVVAGRDIFIVAPFLTRVNPNTGGAILLDAARDLYTASTVDSSQGGVAMRAKRNIVVTGYLSKNAVIDGQGTASLNVNRSDAGIVFNSIGHTLSTATSGVIVYTKPDGAGVPDVASAPEFKNTYRITYVNMDNLKPLVDGDRAIDRSFLVAPNNKATTLKAVPGSIDFNHIQAKDATDAATPATMQVWFANPEKKDNIQGTLTATITSSNVATFDPTKLKPLVNATVNAAVVNDIFDAALFIGNLVNGANYLNANEKKDLVNLRPSFVYTQFFGGSGKDRFIFLESTQAFAKTGPAIDGRNDGALAKNTLDYSLFIDPADPLNRVLVDLARDRAINLNCCQDDGFTGIENVVVGNKTTSVDLTADVVKNGQPARPAVFVVGYSVPNSTEGRMAQNSVSTIRVDVNSDAANGRIADIVRYFGNLATVILAVDNLDTTPIANRDDIGKDFRQQGVIDNNGVNGAGGNQLITSGGVVRSGGKGGLDVFVGVNKRDANGNIIYDNGLPVLDISTATESENFLRYSMLQMLDRGITTQPLFGTPQPQEIFDQINFVTFTGLKATSYIYVRQFLAKGYNNYNNTPEFYQDQVYRMVGDFFPSLQRPTLAEQRNVVNADLGFANNVVPSQVQSLVNLLSSGQDEAVVVANFVQSAYFQSKALLTYGGSAQSAWVKAFLNSERVYGNAPGRAALEAQLIAQLTADPNAKAAIFNQVFALDEHKVQIVNFWVKRFLIDPVNKLQAGLTGEQLAKFQARRAQYHFDLLANGTLPFPTDYSARQQALGTLQNGTLEYAALEQVLNSEAMYWAAQLAGEFGSGGLC